MCTTARLETFNADTVYLLLSVYISYFLFNNIFFLPYLLDFKSRKSKQLYFANFILYFDLKSLHHFISMPGSWWTITYQKQKQQKKRILTWLLQLLQMMLYVALLPG